MRPVLLPVVVALIAVLTTPPALAQKLYRWTDKDGKEHYSDTLPSEAIDAAREELNKTSGSTVGQVERALTPEERATLAASAEAEAELAEARRLFRALGRPNVMIKIPATKESLPAVEQAIPGLHLVLLAGLRLNGRDRDGVDDVVGLAAAREIVRGFGQPLENRPDGGRAGQPFGQLVADVSRIDVGEDQDVRASGDGGALRLRFADGRHEGGVELQLAVDLQFRRARTNGPRGLDHLVCHRVLRRALGREREHGDARLDIEQRAAGLGRGHRDLGQLRGRRIDHHRRIGEDHRAVRAERPVRHDHHHHRRDDAEARLQPDRNQRRTHRVRRRIGRARHRSVGLPRAHHHVSEIERIENLPLRLVERHALRPPQLIELLRVSLQIGRLAMIENDHVRQRRAQRLRPPANRSLVAEHRHPRQPPRRARAGLQRRADACDERILSRPAAQGLRGQRATFHQQCGIDLERLARLQRLAALSPHRQLPIGRRRPARTRCWFRRA